MKSRFYRIGSLAVSLSLLITAPSFASVPIVPPLQVAQESGFGRGETQSVTGGYHSAEGPESGRDVALQGPGGEASAGGIPSPGGAVTPGRTSMPGGAVSPGGTTPPGGAVPPGDTRSPVGTPPSGLTPQQENFTSPGLNTGPGAALPGGSSQVVHTVKQPDIQSEGAVLMDAATGEFLYSKDADTRFYPASITKLMTALLAAESCNLEDTVTFSKSAVTNLESGAVTLGLVEGDKLTVRQCLYGLLLKSANEVANGLAEHAAGSVNSFAGRMNARAKELGCTNTNFVNPNGLNDPNHMTTPHDMALIAREAFQNPTVAKVASTLSYEIPATNKAGVRTVTMGHKMVNPKDSRYYPGVIGGKTGYTSLAGNTLVTCAERDGRRLIAVVMKSSSTQYTDTKALLDYGFSLKSGNSPAARWIQTGNQWQFVKSDGKKAADTWMTIDDVVYWFDSDAAMATGWRHFSNGAWYYFKSGGRMAAGEWVESAGKWYYLGADGVMLKNGMTPDGYLVDGNGSWVK